jgi:2'-5' RNA ligase
MRVFVAVTPPEQAVRHLAERWEVARSGMRSGRAAPVEGWHVTLEFLGDVDDLAGVRNGLARVAQNCRDFSVRLAGAGSFGGRGRKILWAGLSGQVDRLTDLAADVRAATAQALGAEPESRPFRAHVTLARDVRDAERPLDILRSYRGPSWTVGELQLISSELGAGVNGASRYTVVQAWPLAEDHDCATGAPAAP